MLAASAACALAPGIATMAGARFVQGFAGGWAMVIGRAVIVDLARGIQLVRALNVVQAVGGIAPVVAPLLGGLILQVGDWRAPFWVITALVVGMIAAAYAAVPESLPAERRHAGGLGTFAADARAVLGNRRYVGYALVSASVMVALFAYVATSAFILQSMNGLSPLAYSVAFAANAGGMTATALLAARLAGRVATRRVILAGQVLALAAGLAMLAGALWLGTPLLLALACFFALMAAVGLIWGNAGALAAETVPGHPGTGSAVLGMLQWGTAGVAATLAGLGGTGTAVPMAVLMTAGAAASILGLRLSRPRAATTPASSPSPSGDDRFELGMAVEFGQHAFHMTAAGVQADRQLAGDRARVLTLVEPGQDVEFAIGQRRPAAVGRRRLRAMTSEVLPSPRDRKCCLTDGESAATIAHSERGVIQIDIIF